jgi:phosphoribosylanthranilate isomerase
MQRTRIKICGLTREQDVTAALDAGADALGFVLYEKSSRAVSLARAQELVRGLPPFVTPVLLLVNATQQAVEAAASALPQALLQFHGDETAERCEAYRKPYIRAARMQPGFDLLHFAHQYINAQAILLDADVEGFGGGGKAFDWSLIPLNVNHRIVLSGGLTPANVTDGITRVRPWAVDVSSGVEVSKGVKSAELIRQFCDAVRRADNSVYP